MMVWQFEELIPWQKARNLTKAIYEASRHFDRGLAHAVQQASIAMMACVAQGFESRGNPDYYRYLGAARARNAELRSHLYLALDLGYLAQTDFDILRTEGQEINRLLNELMSNFHVSRPQQETLPL